MGLPHIGVWRGDVPLRPDFFVDLSSPIHDFDAK
jgi:hypothetical protein